MASSQVFIKERNVGIRDSPRILGKSCDRIWIPCADTACPHNYQSARLHGHIHETDKPIWARSIYLSELPFWQKADAEFIFPYFLHSRVTQKCRCTQAIVGNIPVRKWGPQESEGFQFLHKFQRKESHKWRKLVLLQRQLEPPPPGWLPYTLAEWQMSTCPPGQF